MKRGKKKKLNAKLEHHMTKPYAFSHEVSAFIYIYIYIYMYVYLYWLEHLITFLLN